MTTAIVRMFFIAVAMMFFRLATPVSYDMKPTWISHMIDDREEVELLGQNERVELDLLCEILDRRRLLSQ